MKKSAILLLFFFSSSLASAYLLSLQEEKYGVNMVRVQREAQVLWVRDNFDVVFDYNSRKNLRVDFLSDEELMHVLRNPRNRGLLGLTPEKVAPYVERLLRGNYSSEVVSENASAENESSANEGVAGTGLESLYFKKFFLACSPQPFFFKPFPFLAASLVCNP